MIATITSPPGIRPLPVPSVQVWTRLICVGVLADAAAEFLAAEFLTSLLIPDGLLSTSRTVEDDVLAGFSRSHPLSPEVAVPPGRSR